ncbi:hypothetical protein ABT383_33815, partial [Streptomyces humidus]
TPTVTPPVSPPTGRTASLLRTATPRKRPRWAARLLTAALRTADTDLRRLRGTDPDLAERFRRAAARLHGLEHAAPPRDPEQGGSPPAP